MQRKLLCRLRKFTKDEILHLFDNYEKTSLSCKTKAQLINVAVVLLKKKFTDSEELLLFLHLKCTLIQSSRIRTWYAFEIKGAKSFQFASHLTCDKIKQSLEHHFARCQLPGTAYWEKQGLCYLGVISVGRKSANPIYFVANTRLSIVFISHCLKDYVQVASEVMRKIFKGDSIEEVFSVKETVKIIQNLTHKPCKNEILQNQTNSENYTCDEYKLDANEVGKAKHINQEKFKACIDVMEDSPRHTNLSEFRNRNQHCHDSLLGSRVAPNEHPGNYNLSEQNMLDDRRIDWQMNQKKPLLKRGDGKSKVCKEPVSQKNICSDVVQNSIVESCKPKAIQETTFTVHVNLNTGRTEVLSKNDSVQNHAATKIRASLQNQTNIPNYGNSAVKKLFANEDQNRTFSLKRTELCNETQNNEESCLKTFRSCIPTRGTCSKKCYSGSVNNLPVPGSISQMNVTFAIAADCYQKKHKIDETAENERKLQQDSIPPKKNRLSTSLLKDERACSVNFGASQNAPTGPRREHCKKHPRSAKFLAERRTFTPSNFNSDDTPARKLSDIHENVPNNQHLTKCSSAKSNPLIRPLRHPQPFDFHSDETPARKLSDIHENVPNNQHLTKCSSAKSNPLIRPLRHPQPSQEQTEFQEKDAANQLVQSRAECSSSASIHPCNECKKAPKVGFDSESNKTIETSGVSPKSKPQEIRYAIASKSFGSIPNTNSFSVVAFKGRDISKGIQKLVNMGVLNSPIPSILRNIPSTSKTFYLTT